MTYQIGSLVTENKEEATLHLVEILKDNEEVFQEFLCINFGGNADTLLKILLNGDEETTARFRNIFTTYCMELAQDILSEEGVDGCFIM